MRAAGALSELCFADVGGSHLLSRTNHRANVFIACGIAPEIVPAGALEEPPLASSGQTFAHPDANAPHRLNDWLQRRRFQQAGFGRVLARLRAHASSNGVPHMQDDRPNRARDVNEDVRQLHWRNRRRSRHNTAQYRVQA